MYNTFLYRAEYACTCTPVPLAVYIDSIRLDDSTSVVSTVGLRRTYKDAAPSNEPKPKPGQVILYRKKVFVTVVPDKGLCSFTASNAGVVPDGFTVSSVRPVACGVHLMPNMCMCSKVIVTSKMTVHINHGVIVCWDIKSYCLFRIALNGIVDKYSDVVSERKHSPIELAPPVWWNYRRQLQSSDKMPNIHPVTSCIPNSIVYPESGPYSMRYSASQGYSVVLKRRHDDSVYPYIPVMLKRVATTSPILGNNILSKVVPNATLSNRWVEVNSRIENSCIHGCAVDGVAVMTPNQTQHCGKVLSIDVSNEDEDILGIEWQLLDYRWMRVYSYRFGRWVKSYGARIDGVPSQTIHTLPILHDYLRAGLLIRGRDSSRRVTDMHQLGVFVPDLAKPIYFPHYSQNLMPYWQTHIHITVKHQDNVYDTFHIPSLIDPYIRIEMPVHQSSVMHPQQMVGDAIKAMLVDFGGLVLRSASEDIDIDIVQMAHEYLNGKSDCIDKPEEDAISTCSASKRDGTRCRNKPKADSLCGVHIRSAPSTPTLTTKALGITFPSPYSDA